MLMRPLIVCTLVSAAGCGPTPAPEFIPMTGGAVSSKTKSSGGSTTSTSSTETTVGKKPTFTAADARKYADRGVKLAADKLGVKLDFSVESLGRVDKVMTKWHDEGETSESMPTTVYAFGCYLGEVIIKNHGGAWRETAGTPDREKFGAPVVLDLPGGVVCNPLGKAAKLLDNGEEDNFVFFYQTVTTLHKGGKAEPAQSPGHDGR
jgi:hypothetical protein